MGKRDAVGKKYFANKKRFADLMNAFLFDGKQVVVSQKLRELDPNEMIYLEWGVTKRNKPSREDEAIQKVRDILKEAVINYDGHCCYVLLGVENQTDLYYAMAVRSMLYDALNYTQQIADIAKFHEKQEGRKSTKDYFTGMRKTDKLVPVITIVVYWGPDSWDAPRSLHEMFPEDIPQEILDLVPDYKIPVLAPCEVENPDLFQTDLKAVIKALQVMNDKKALKTLLRGPEFQSLEHDAAVAIQAATNLKIKIPETKEVNMCKAVQEWREELLTEGETIGTVKGEAKLARLIAAMSKQGDSAKIAQAAADPEFRAKMYEKYGIK